MGRKSLYLSAIVFFLSIFAVNGVFSQDIPDRPNPPKLVNDYAGLLKAEEVNNLENQLVAFNDSTSTQIAIVTVPSLGDYAISDYAQRLAEKWGIGQKGLNNGILILVTPKSAGSSGQVNISPGYGLEGVIPDITCGEIIDNEMIPEFKKGDYYSGLSNASRTLMALARGEFTYEQYGKSAGKSKGKPFPFGLIIFIVVIILLLSGRSGGTRNRHISSGGLPFWLLMGMMGSGRGSHGGSWGGFSGGGGGGGFGGFGGGSFGGGGASGSW